MKFFEAYKFANESSKFASSAFAAVFYSKIQQHEIRKEYNMIDRVKDRKR